MACNEGGQIVRIKMPFLGPDHQHYRPQIQSQNDVMQTITYFASNLAQIQ
jgi:hypothetical protein